MGIVYLKYLKKRTYQLETTEVEIEPWPTGGAEEKEAFIDAMLEEPCMLEAMVDPTRKTKFNSIGTELIQDYRLLTQAFVQRLVESRMQTKETEEIFYDQLEQKLSQKDIKEAINVVALRGEI